MEEYNAEYQAENDFVYKFQNGRYEVEHKVAETPQLYKYYSNSKYSFDAIYNNYFYISHPFDFNDSMDSSELLWDFRGLKEKDYRNFYGNHNFSDEQLTAYYENDKNDNFSKIRRSFWTLQTNGVGILSLTNNPLNILMWAHYSGEYGFMVEYNKKGIIDDIKKNNIDTLKNYVLYPINYVDHLRQISIPGKYKTADVPFLYSFGVKQKAWEYEKEWRLICFMNGLGVPFSKVSALKGNLKGKAERKLFYSKDAINKIILGKYFFSSNFVKSVESTSPGEPIIYNLIHSKEAQFVDYLFKNYRDKLCLCGEQENEGVISRKFFRVNMDKLGYNRFRVTYGQEAFEY
ncbi:MAG: DUF2971 domain-containing protein [Bacteroidota bacterium]